MAGVENTKSQHGARVAAKWIGVGLSHDNLQLKVSQTDFKIVPITKTHSLHNQISYLRRLTQHGKQGVERSGIHGWDSEHRA